MVAGFFCGVVSAEATTTLSWNTFRGEAGSSSGLNLNCSNLGAQQRLVATFSSSVDIPDFMGMQATVVVGNMLAPHQPSFPLSPFWHFEQGGCNEGGVVLGDAMPSGGSGIATLWGTQGQSAEAFLFFVPDTPGPSGQVGRGRFIIELARATPIALSAGQSYFGFTLDLSTCAANACTGCGDAVGFNFALADLRGPDGIVSSTWDDTGDGFACANQGDFCSITAGTASPEAASPRSDWLPVPQTDTPCDPVAVQPGTWGRLKLLYR